ncbi:GRIP and coiled-coil domain-containing protein 1 [Drosophila guanche]|uniref:Blast:GRIP and coiled-coil domain-containing protein 1 n=1 Tax=Drosophila guanche TaxID=7266 RepID=A0A3B0K5U1_DROGU|nr:GRIP and coiled-coil domain-containing protein 1 [Drosophila guanche]SPP83420.1 blast:GRIP and coiled-coil domain-containing protein 1 [Drosophila guanche]
MEKRQRELESLVSTQKEQLTRYEKRLKDVVTAYKGLMKEKEALETSLTAHAEATAATGTGSPAKVTDPANVNGTASADATDAADSNPSAEGQLQTQIITLMNSLATLSAEKSRMEASFQADKKQLRSQIAQKEQSIQELHAKAKEQAAKAKADVDEVKAKWIIERQEREKETNNQMLMIRELQKLYADERHLKDNIEMQLNNFKTQFASNEAENSRLRDLQAQLKEARHQLKQFQAKAEHTAVATSTDNASLLHQVRQEMQQLKEQHAVAIKQEQRRVLRAEEQSRKQAALHEGRVANLEARLAELSTTVGSYDRLRQQDQDSIHALKQQLQDLEQAQARPAPALRTLSEDVDLATLVDEIVRLKKLLTSANARSANPIDLNEILSLGTSASASSDSHVHCDQQLQGVQKMLEAGKQQRQLLEQKIHLQQSHIQTLQEKVQVLNRNIDESEQELKQQGDKLRQALKTERTKWQEAKAELENETRCKLNELEQLLQKQRQRSLQLLDEKEQEIKTLQTSFEVFHTAGGGGSGASALPVEPTAAESYNYSSDGESVEVEVERDRRLQVKSKKLSLGENCHMLHYANELARKDIEITTLRKAKYSAESTLRKAIQDKVTSQQDMHEKIECLEEQVDRLERCKTREGANLEYLKNVIISYILTRDADGKRHMLNAISAVLQFTSSEMQAINATFQKK